MQPALHLHWNDQCENIPDSAFETAETRGMVDQSISLMLEEFNLQTLILIFYVTWAMVSNPFSSSENGNEYILIDSHDD